MPEDSESSLSRDFKGIWIPKEIWLHPDLTYFEKFLIAEIHSLDHGEGCYASNKYLADFMHSTESSIANSISHLRKLGMIVDRGFDGRRRRISLHSTVNAGFTEGLTQDSSVDERSIIDKNKEKKDMQNKKRSARETDSRISHILKEWYPELYEKRYGVKPLINFGKDGKAIKERLSLLDKESEGDKDIALETLKKIIQYVHAVADSPKPQYPFTGGIGGISHAVQAERFNEARKHIRIPQGGAGPGPGPDADFRTARSEDVNHRTIPKELQERLARAMREKDRAAYEKVQQEIKQFQEG